MMLTDWDALAQAAVTGSAVDALVQAKRENDWLRSELESVTKNHAAELDFQGDMRKVTERKLEKLRAKRDADLSRVRGWLQATPALRCSEAELLEAIGHE